MSRTGRVREVCRFGEPRKRLHTVVLVGFTAVVLLLAPRPLAAQVSNSPLPTPSSDPKTFVRRSSFHLKTHSLGHLQLLLRQAYPDSFKAGVDVFWEPRDGWVSPEVFDWWVARVDPGGLTPQAAEPMFSRFSDESRVFSDPREREICAVVGPSRNLVGSGYGRLIDAHEVVIRMNRAPRDGFESDVGSKTTHHMTWPIPRLEHEADRRAFLLLTPVTLHTEDPFARILEVVESDPGWDPRRVRIINPEFLRYVHRNWLDNAGLFPSTGFIALMIAVHVCDEVNVFGFGADAQGRWDHYYNDERTVGSHLHASDTEGEITRELEARGIFKVYLGNRTENGVEFPGFQIDAKDED